MKQNLKTVLGNFEVSIEFIIYLLKRLLIKELNKLSKRLHQIKLKSLTIITIKNTIKTLT